MRKRAQYVAATWTLALMLVLLFLLCAWAILPVGAQETTRHIKQNRCSTIEELVDSVRSMPPEIRNVTQVMVLVKDDAQRWIAAMNALPPVTSTKVDRVALVIGSHSENILFVLELDGCITGAAEMPKVVHQMILRDSRNERGNVL